MGTASQRPSFCHFVVVTQADWVVLVGPVVRHSSLCLRIVLLGVCRRISWRYRLEKDGTCTYDSRCRLRGLSSR